MFGRETTMIGKNGWGRRPGVRHRVPRRGTRGQGGRRACRAGVIWLMIVSLIAGSPPPVRAWGRLGHRAAAQLAESRLSPRARAVIQDLLEPGESLADASTWADEHSREIPGSASWHYVNVSIASAHYDPADCKGRGCVVSKIPEFRAILVDRQAPRARRRQALRFFVHLVQDVHQPLHVADRGDRGGNSLQLRMGRHENTNLHQVWDSGLLRSHYRARDEPELIADLKALADRPESRGWTRGRIEDWADESLTLGRRAYHDSATRRALRPGDEIGQGYIDANLPAARERLAQSGVRLAALLNEILE
jgi:hypothetical protein